MKIKVKQATKQGYILCDEGGVCDLSYPKSKLRRGRVQGNGWISPTITASPCIYRLENIDKENSMQKVKDDQVTQYEYKDGVVYFPRNYISKQTEQVDNEPDLQGYRIRKLTPKECMRLMGFDDSDYDSVQEVGVSNSQLYKQCGNSIVVDVLYHIYKELYKAMPYLFENLKVGSFFSGIGAFEKGLDRLYKDINSGSLINNAQ